MAKRIIAAIAALLFALTAMPLALAKGVISTRYATPSGYDGNDYQKMVAFLEQEDEDGVKNGSKLSSSYSPEDPTTWGLNWEEVDGSMHLSSVTLNNEALAGALDLSDCTQLGYLSCTYNSLTSIDVSGCTALYYLDCDYNSVTAIDVSGCTALATLNCRNNALTSVDVSGCTALKSISFSSNPLTSLNVSGCTALKTDFSSIPNTLLSLDASGCTALTEIYLPDGALTSLNVSDCTALTSLSCGGNALTSLNVSGCTVLDGLRCADNSLTSLDLSGCEALTELWCGENPLASLDVSGLPALNLLSCDATPLTSLDLSGCTSLDRLFCYNGALTELDLSGCSALTILECNDNALTVLDLSGCSALEELRCENNRLKLLDLSDCPKLKLDRATASDGGSVSCTAYDDYFYAYAEPDENCGFIGWYSADGDLLSTYTFIDVEGNDYTVLNARFQRIVGDDNNDGYFDHDYDKIVAFLELEDEDGVKNGTKLSSSYPTLGLDAFSENFEVSWTEEAGLKYLSSLSLSDKNLVGDLDVSGCTHLHSIYCSESTLGSIDASGCTALTELACDSGKVNAVDVSDCTALTDLRCYDNSAVTSIDASGCTALESLSCWNSSELTELAVSGCTALTSLTCNKTALTSLDVSGLVSLDSLNCNESKLTELSLSGCTALTELWCYRNSLTLLDASGLTALTGLYCNNNALASLDVSGCTALETLQCYSNPMTALDVTDCTRLDRLSCSECGLTSINASGCSALTALWCYDSAVTELDISGCTALNTLDCSNNKLTSLDVSDCVGLAHLNCKGNALTELDLSHNAGLWLNGLTAVGGGTIGCIDNGAHAYTGQVSVSAVPDDGCNFVGWFDSEGTLVSEEAELDCHGINVNVLNAVFESALGVPEMSLSTVNSTGKAKIAWSEVEGAVKYEVWRSDAKNGTYSRVFTTTKLEYTNTGAKAGEKWYYKVRAIAEDGAEGEFCAPKFRTTKLPQAQVTGGHVASTGKNKLTWEEVSGAEKYEIWRSDEKTGDFTKMLTTQNLSYINTGAKAGEKWYYKVVAVHENSAANSTSAIKGITCDLAKPVITVSLSNKKPLVSWDAVSGATGYEVWRRVGTSGDYKLLKVTDKTSFKNTGAAAGTTYYYKVVAVNDNAEASSAASAAKSITSK